MRLRLSVIVLLTLFVCSHALSADLAAITDRKSYNVGAQVRIRFEPATSATASIRYAGEEKPVVTEIPIAGAEYKPLWDVPWTARTGRYEVDLARTGGSTIRAATSFAVHRQLVKVVTLELDKAFYTSGDPVNPRIVVQNFSDRRLDHIEVDF